MARRHVLVPHCLKAVCAIFIILVAGRAQAAMETQPNAISAIPVSAPPPIDGIWHPEIWSKGAHAALGYDLRSQGAAAQATDAYLLRDRAALYVAFVAKQSSEIVANQHTNNVGDNSDDMVAVRFWPNAESGFVYRFASTPIGTRYQSSSENSIYEPTWDSVGRITADGYVVTMRIPLRIMHYAARDTWRVQFSRAMTRTGQIFVWSHGPQQSATDDLTYAGYLKGMPAVASIARPQPRVGVYTLGSAGSGGTAFRMGADVSVPLTKTTSFVAALHPDFSNVEQDQQTISPTAYRRFFSELRPFFTQLGNYFNNFDCNGCIDNLSLYTPGIPTPRNGYAIEGRQGNFSFAGFDAVGAGRTDNAEVMQWTRPDRHVWSVFQRVSVSKPGLQDVTDMWQGHWSNRHNFGGYLTLANERGTNVTDPSKGTLAGFGLNLFTPKSGAFFETRRIGAQYAPADGFNTINDIAGYAVYTYKHWDYKPGSAIRFFEVDANENRYHNSIGQLNQGENAFSVGIGSKINVDLWYNHGEGYYIIPGVLDNGGYLNQSGPHLTYLAGTSTPVSLAYYTGRFGSGYLRTWSSNATARISRRLLFLVEADQTNYTEDSGAQDRQWLERASLTYELGHDSSASVGLRKIIGVPPPVGTSATNANFTNVSFAFHRRIAHDEFYIAYGDPSQLVTKPVMLVKFIHYFGAEKGA